MNKPAPHAASLRTTEPPMPRAHVGIIIPSNTMAQNSSMATTTLSAMRVTSFILYLIFFSLLVGSANSCSLSLARSRVRE